MNHFFSELRAANAARLPTFRSRAGGLAHTSPGPGIPVGFDWDRRTWCNALLGEVGELAGEIKKVRRGDAPLEARTGAIGDEATDVLTYLDFVAWRFGTTLEHALLLQFGFPGVTEGKLRFEDLPKGRTREGLEGYMATIGECVGVLCRAAIEGDGRLAHTEPIRLTNVNVALATLVDALFHLLRSLDLDPVTVVTSKWNAVSVRVDSPVRLWSEWVWMEEGKEVQGG